MVFGVSPPTVVVDDCILGCLSMYQPDPLLMNITLHKFLLSGLTMILNMKMRPDPFLSNPFILRKKLKLNLMTSRPLIRKLSARNYRLMVIIIFSYVHIENNFKYIKTGFKTSKYSIKNVFTQFGCSVLIIC